MAAHNAADTPGSKEGRSKPRHLMIALLGAAILGGILLSALVAQGTNLAGHRHTWAGFTAIQSDLTEAGLPGLAGILRSDWFRVAALIAPAILTLWCVGRALTYMDQVRRQRDVKLRQLSQAVEQARSAIVITDLHGAIEYVNPAFSELTGYSFEEVRGRNPRFLQSGSTPQETYDTMWKELHAGRQWRGEFCNRTRTGELFWELASISPLRDERGRTTHYVAVKENITVQKNMEAELRAAASIDRLTGLPNRALLCDRLRQAIFRAQRHSDFRFAVLFLDMDRFKLINDSLGHDVGDLMLQEIARRLSTAVRAGDSVSRPDNAHTTARLGGDEFVILLEDLQQPADAGAVAERLLEVLSQPYRLRDHDIFSTASIGIVTSDQTSESPEQILRDADTAMYEAKLAGKGRHVVFGMPMRQRVQRRLDLETDLRKAVDSDQLFLMYEPIVSLHTGKVERFEALLRWRHPQRGLIPPAEFIPIAEETGLILPIGEWVLRAACRQFAHWRSAGAAPAGISVNLSRVQLLLHDLPGRIDAILQETGIPPGCLHLEVTESTVMRDVTAAARILHAIKALGVKLDIDDFGTGYSSLACLHEFPMDVLKIDRSFIANIERGRDFAALVQAVTQLARNLNIKVVGEGIETADQAIILQAHDCEFGQGYFFSQPMSGHAAAQYRTDVRVWGARQISAGLAAPRLIASAR